jgi:hypothetical protein
MSQSKDDYKLEDIVLGALFVAGQSRNVRINYDKLYEVGRKYSKDDLQLPKWDAPVFPERSNKDTLDFILLGNAINFAFNDFKTGEKYLYKYKDVPFKGAYGMWAALKSVLDKGTPILDGSYLENLTEIEAKKIFNKDSQIPMLNERVKILNEVGSVLNKHYAGHFYNVVAAANGYVFNKGEGLVERLVRDFPSFRDDWNYNGKRVAFAKRAQLAAAMIYENLLPEVKIFRDGQFERLTVFADYELPKALRSMEILEYSPQLADKIDKGELIPAGSNEEIEIRGCTIAATDELVKFINYTRGSNDESSFHFIRHLAVTDKLLKFLNGAWGSNDESSFRPIKHSNKVTAPHIDYKLWEEGRNYKDAKAHMTITTAY